MKQAATVLLFMCVAIVARAQGQQYVISTYAGGGPPSTPTPGLYMWFGFAQSVAADRAGNIYFTAGWAGSLNCVFKLDGGGIVTRFAGTGRPGFSGDGGPATIREPRDYIRG
jgi:serine/threonine-protein kinase